MIRFERITSNGSPAHAGIDLSLSRLPAQRRRFPRTRGDRPWSATCGLAASRVPPHKWAVGTTFEWEFDFPVNPNSAYDREPEPKRKTSRSGKTAAARTPGRKVSKPTTTAAKPKASKKSKRVRLTPEERQERGRARAVEKRSKLKEQGLCRDCRQPAIPGQTRCPSCAAKHRQSRQPRQSKDNGRHNLMS